MESEERSWGVTRVPERLRRLSGLDVGLLWGSLGISLLVLVAGTLLAPLGLLKALLRHRGRRGRRLRSARARGSHRRQAAGPREWCCSGRRSATAARTSRPR